MADADAGREVAPALVHALLSYVGRVAGDSVLTHVITASGLDPDDVNDERRWFSSAEVIALVEAAADACHDRELGRATGAELWLTLSAKPGYLDMIRSVGSVHEAMIGAASRASKISTGRSIAVAGAGDNEVRLVANYRDLPSVHRFYCGTSSGFFSQIPSAFGLIGEAVELSCQLAGDDECVYRVSWRDDDQLRRTDPDLMSDSAVRAQARLHHLEQVHQLTSELLGVGRVDEVLERITAEAGHAVQAPRYLLAVRVNEHDALRVHHRGFRPGTADTFAERMLAGETGEVDGVLVADVTCDRRYYGRLAACFPRGSTFATLDRRLLAAYARHAAAVLEHVASLEAASDDRDTARALLGLAHRLAEATTEKEVVQRIAETLLQAARCDMATTWAWDAETGSLCLQAMAETAVSPEHAEPVCLSGEDATSFRRLAERPAPMLLAPADVPEPVRSLHASRGVPTLALVPIVVQGEFDGVVCAGFSGDTPRDELLLALLTGLADHASIALQSVRLLEQARFHASHDDLTGLPNRQQIEEHGARRIAAARETQEPVALLFVDLDRFKSVNDSLGHAVGDELLQQAAARIASATRANDVLARLGGDEFIVLLTELGGSDAAVAIAERVVDSLRAPFTLAGGHLVSISGSVGVALSPEHGSEYPTLATRADAAMYQAKALGRDRVAIWAELTEDGCRGFSADVPRQRAAGRVTPGAWTS